MICIYYLSVKLLFENSLLKLTYFVNMVLKSFEKMQICCNYVTEIILKNVDAHCSAIIYV